MADLREHQVVKCIVAAGPDRSPRGIASALRTLIRSGALSSGTRLPTVRSLAAELHVSASTLSEAWHLLAAEGMIHSAGRNGTIVLRRRPVETTERLGRMTWIVGRHGLDLSTGMPDSSLLPDVSRALTDIDVATVENYQGVTILPDLEDAIRANWQPAARPFSMTMMHGAYDAVDRALSAIMSVGDRVAVEVPNAPVVVDLIEMHGGTPVAVTLDDEGIEPKSLATALLTRPVALVLQPRAQNPSGVAMSWSRAEELAALLRPTKTLVIEDDHSGLVSVSPLTSLMRWLPDRVVRIQSFSKSHGPDLRLAAVGAPHPVMHRMELRRRLGGGWESRLLQRALLQLLEDPKATSAVEQARDTYRFRRAAMAQSARRHGLHTTGSDGLNLWVEVENESQAIRRLAQEDIGVCPGSPLAWSGPDTHHVRITTAILDPDDADRVTAQLCGDQ